MESALYLVGSVSFNVYIKYIYIPSKSPACRSPSLFPLPGYVAYDSVLLSSVSKLAYYSAETVCCNFSGNLDFQKGSLIHGWLSKTVFSRALRPQPRAAKPDHGPLAGATAEIEVFVPITQYMGEWDFFQLTWHMVLDPTVPQRHFACK